MKYEGTILEEIMKNLMEDLKQSSSGKIYIMTSDTETTGLVKPDITQFAAKIITMSLDSETNNIVFEDIERFSKYYYPEKKVDPFAAYVTNIVRKIDMQDKEYVKSLKDAWASKNKKFNEKNLIQLEDTLPVFTVNVIDDLIQKYDIKLIAGHNYYGYDYRNVLKGTYNFQFPQDRFLDTMLYPLHTKEAKSLRGKTLDNEVKKAIKSPSKTDKERFVKEIQNGKQKLFELLEELGLTQEYTFIRNLEENEPKKIGTLRSDFENKLNEKLSMFKMYEYESFTLERKYEVNMLLREEAHDAIIDTELNEFLTKRQLQDLYDDLILNPAPKEEKAKAKVPDNRGYTNNDVIYVNTQINGDNVVKTEDVIEFSIKKNISTIVIVNNMLSNVFRDKDAVKKVKAKLSAKAQSEEEKQRINEHKIKMLFGFVFEDKITGRKTDIVYKNTLQYRLANTILFSRQSGKTYDEKLEDIVKYTENLVIPSEKISKPKMATFEDKNNYFFFKRYKEKGIFTKQESDDFNVKATIDKSLTGIYTSDVKQEWFAQVLTSFEAPDFEFYAKLGLSAFPPLQVLYSGVDKEPDNMEDYILVLRQFIKEKWPEKQMDTIIENLNIDRASRNPKLPPITLEDYNRRIEEELKVLTDMGDTDYIKYFFLVSDWENKFKFGAGRGSVGGSLIAFILNITDTNPLEFDLLFERFLDPSRPDYPDIDFDVEDKYYVEAVLTEEYNIKVKNAQDYTSDLYNIYNDYLLETYIKNETNFIGKIKTFSEATRKVLANTFIRMATFPHAVQKSLRDEWDDEKTILENIKNNTKSEEILDMYNEDYFSRLEKLVGLYTNFGVHAAGVLAYPGHAHCIGPVDESNTTHFDKKDIEKLKMIKMDALGLTTLLILTEIVQKVLKDDPNANLFKNNITPRTDPNVLLGLQNGFTKGTFQMESNGMRRILNDLAPIEFEDIIACTALYRPGPMDSIPAYISLAQSAKRSKYDIEYIPKRDWEELDIDEKKTIISNSRQKMIEGGVAELQVQKDSVIENVITREPYLNSEDFVKETKAKYTKLKEKTYSEDEIAEYENYAKFVEKYGVETADHFVKVMKEAEEFLYNDKVFAEQTMETYKTLVYQEQIMLFSIAAADYTKAESNSLRKAIGKKIAELMAEHKINLIAGLVKKGMPEVNAEYLWNKIESFGKYAFNKSHAASYSIITYTTQYYKEHYPMQAYSTMLKHAPEKNQMSIIKEITDRGIELKLQKLDENFSLDFEYEGNTIYVPLSYVKGLGEANLYSLTTLLEEYEMSSLEEMVLLNGRVEKSTLENLGMLGFFEKQNQEGEYYSLISQKEWYYLSDVKNPENDKEKLLTDSILNKVFKSKIVTLSKMLYEQNKNTIYENESLLKELSILEKMSQHYELLERGNENIEVGKENESTNYYEEIQKQKEKVFKIINNDKKMEEDLKTIFLKNLKSGNYEFFKKENNEEAYKNYKEQKQSMVKEKAKEVRKEIQIVKQEVIGSFKVNQNIAEVSKTFDNKENRFELYNSRKLTDEETQDVYVKKQVNIFANELDLEAPLTASKQLDYLPVKYSAMTYEQRKNLEVEDKQVNVILLAEFPNAFEVEQDGTVSLFKGRGNDNGPVEVWFEHLQAGAPLDNTLQIGYMTFFDMKEKEFEALEDDEKRRLYLNAIDEKLKPLFNSGIENIVLSTAISKNSRLAKFIETRREKKFLPQKGETHRIIYEGNGKNVCFVDKLFPYPDLNMEMYQGKLEKTGQAIWGENYNKARLKEAILTKVELNKRKEVKREIRRTERTNVDDLKDRELKKARQEMSNEDIKYFLEPNPVNSEERIMKFNFITKKLMDLLEQKNLRLYGANPNKYIYIKSGAQGDKTISVVEEILSQINGKEIKTVNKKVIKINDNYTIDKDGMIEYRDGQKVKEVFEKDGKYYYLNNAGEEKYVIFENKELEIINEVNEIPQSSIEKTFDVLSKPTKLYMKNAEGLMVSFTLLPNGKYEGISSGKKLELTIRNTYINDLKDGIVVVITKDGDREKFNNVNVERISTEPIGWYIEQMTLTDKNGNDIIMYRNETNEKESIYKVKDDITKVFEVILSKEQEKELLKNEKMSMLLEVQNPGTSRVNREIKIKDIKINKE